MPIAPQHIPTSQSSPSWDDFLAFMRQYTQSASGEGFGQPEGGLEAFFASLFGDSGAEGIALESPAFPHVSMEPDDRFARMGENLGKAIKSSRERKNQAGIDASMKRIQTVPRFTIPEIQPSPPVTPSRPQSPTTPPPPLQQPSGTVPSPPLSPPPAIRRAPSTPSTPSTPTRPRPPTQPPGPMRPQPPAQPGVSFGRQRPPMTAQQYFDQLNPQGQALINQMRQKAGRPPLRPTP